MKDWFNNFLKGARSVLEIYPRHIDLDRYSHFNLDDEGAFQSDKESLRSDWVNIGNDMRKAIGGLNYGRRR